MAGIARQQRQLLAALAAHPHPALPAQFHNLLQSLVLPLPRHHNMVKTPVAGAQSLLYRVQTVQYLH